LVAREEHKLRVCENRDEGTEVTGGWSKLRVCENRDLRGLTSREGGAN
jgi:hypothetical protein